MKIYKLTDTQKVVAISTLIFTAVAFLMVGMVVPSFPSNTSIDSFSIRSTPVISTAPAVAAEIVVSKMDETIVPPVEKISAASVSTTTPKNSQVTLDFSWRMGDVKAPIPNITLHEKISRYSIVTLEPHSAHRPGAGEAIQLPMLDGQTVVANVESSTTHPNGDYTWSGHLQGYGTDYPVVMTYGERSVFATVTTPEGSYTMESIDGSGWLYKNPAEIELSIAGAPDFLEVDSL